MFNRKTPIHCILGIVIVLAAGHADARACFDYESGNPDPVVLPAAVAGATDLALLDGLVVAVDPVDGVTVVDLASNAVVLHLPLQGYWGVAGDGRVAVLGPSDPGQAVLLELDDPTAPGVHQISSQSGEAVSGVAVEGAKVTVITGGRNVEVFAISDGGAARVLGFEAASRIRHAVWSGEDLVLGGWSFFAGVAVVGISGPVADLRDWVRLPDLGATDLAVHGNAAYAPAHGEAIHVVDMTDRELLVDAGTFGSGYAKLAAHGGILHVLNATGVLDLYDLDDPFSPALFASVDLQLSGNLTLEAGPSGILAADDDRALLLPLSCSAVAGTEVPEERGDLGLSAVPNPFNPRVEIGFVLDRGEPVTVTIHDAAGRLVRRVANGQVHQAGRHSLVWDGRDDAGYEVASGVYLVRFTASGRAARQKVTLLR